MRRNLQFFYMFWIDRQPFINANAGNCDWFYTTGFASSHPRSCRSFERQEFWFQALWANRLDESYQGGDRWKRDFRMTAETFLKLVNLLTPYLQKEVSFRIYIYFHTYYIKGHSKSTYASNVDGPLPRVPVGPVWIKSARAPTGSLGCRTKQPGN